MKQKFKIGDKVRFLNTTGSGIIQSIRADGVIYVNIEDGFEIPCKSQDLVLIESEESASKMFNRKGEFTSAKVKPRQGSDIKEDTNTAETPKKIFNGKKPEKGLYYAILTKEDSMPANGDFDAYLVNYSAMEVYFRFILSYSKGDKTVKTGILEAGDAFLITEIKHQERFDWLKGKIQFMVVDRKTEKLYPAYTSNFQIKEQKLLNEANFQSNVFFDELALLHKVFEFKNLLEEKPNPDTEIKKLKETLGAVKKEPRKRINTTLIDRHIKENGFAEVDLHIEKLRGDYKMLRDEEKIRTQMSYFTQCLDSAISKELSRVVFIHGIGESILKNKIRKILDEYENIKYNDASLLKYGGGATEVFFN